MNAYSGRTMPPRSSVGWFARDVGATPAISTSCRRFLPRRHYPACTATEHRGEPMANAVLAKGLKEAEAERDENAAGWAAPAATETATSVEPETVSDWTPAHPMTGARTMTMGGVASA